jgi:SAM-dependent methyltransferase
MSLAQHLLNEASAPYRAAGRYAYHFARGKLARDPVFEAILARGLLTQRARILDLGCGQGLLAALLVAARGASGAGAWPENWPPAPQPSNIRGIELLARDVRRARLALSRSAEFVAADVRRTDFGSVDGVVILDVLQYVDFAEQCRILQRVRTALIGDGVLLLRIGDAHGGFGFTFGKWVDRVKLLAVGHRISRLHYRSVQAWRELLFSTGFDTEVVPMSRGTPFANVLIIARPRAAP